MSELIKALLKERKATRKDDAKSQAKAIDSISEETANVIIMLAQIMWIFGNMDDVQRYIDLKTERLSMRLDTEAGVGAAQEALGPTT
ncbi:hypothetical protein EI53_01279 [Fusobacterium naviforme]|nr:hypothetical protein F7P78_06390 [Fusobacterium naviforme]PSL10217.1 hypothetical protein EI53_01279 [Fusobacterium naviforme]STO27627.1 Uncharacterised protein [Fusobacterium naviforme]